MSSIDDNVVILNDSSEESKNNPIELQKHIQTSLKNDVSSEEWQPQHLTTDCSPITLPPKPHLAGRAQIPSDKVLSSLPQKFTKTGNKKDYKN
jgi:hypothetical protein